MHILSLCDNASNAPKYPVHKWSTNFNTFVKIHTFTQNNDNPLMFLVKQWEHTCTCTYLSVTALATGSLLWITEKIRRRNSSTLVILVMCFSLSWNTFRIFNRRKLILDVWQNYSYHHQFSTIITCMSSVINISKFRFDNQQFGKILILAQYPLRHTQPYNNLKAERFITESCIVQGNSGWFQGHDR